MLDTIELRDVRWLQRCVAQFNSRGGAIATTEPWSSSPGLAHHQAAGASSSSASHSPALPLDIASLQCFVDAHNDEGRPVRPLHDTEVLRCALTLDSCFPDSCFARLHDAVNDHNSNVVLSRDSQAPSHGPGAAECGHYDAAPDGSLDRCLQNGMLNHDNHADQLDDSVDYGETDHPLPHATDRHNGHLLSWVRRTAHVIHLSWTHWHLNRSYPLHVLSLLSQSPEDCRRGTPHSSTFAQLSHDIMSLMLKDSARLTSDALNRADIDFVKYGTNSCSDQPQWPTTGLRCLSLVVTLCQVWVQS
jgi:hypothetical protein